MERFEGPNLGKVQHLLLDWFGSFGRDFPWRELGVETYQLIVSEVLLQQTRAETVQAIYETFFSQFPGWKELSDAQLSEIEEVIKPLGIWRRRADTLSRLSKEVVKLRTLPWERQQLEELPGFGQYVVNAYQLLVQGIPKPLLDTNMARVLERCFGPRTKADIRYDHHLQSISNEIVNHPRAVEINWAILDLGALVCRPKNPKCEVCPISEHCRYNLENAIS